MMECQQPGVGPSQVQNIAVYHIGHLEVTTSYVQRPGLRGQCVWAFGWIKAAPALPLAFGPSPPANDEQYCQYSIPRVDYDHITGLTDRHPNGVLTWLPAQQRNNLLSNQKASRSLATGRGYYDAIRKWGFRRISNK